MPQTGGGGRDRERILGTRRNKQTKKKKSSHTEKRKKRKKKRKDSVREIYSEGNLSSLIECTLKKKKQNKLKLDKYSTKRSVVFPLTKKIKKRNQKFSIYLLIELKLQQLYIYSFSKL